MVDRHLFVGDSYAAYYNWPNTVVAARAGATRVAALPVDTVNSPAWGGTLLMPTDGTSCITAWSTRVAPYLGSSDRLYFHFGINDLYFMARNPLSAFTLVDWQKAWNSANTNYLAAGTRPAHVYAIGIPYISGVSTDLTPAVLPMWMRGSIQTGRHLMNRATAERCRAFGWTYISTVNFRPDWLLPDGYHPTPDAGEPYYVSQVLAAG